VDDAQLMDQARTMARQRGNSHDCIVPVSGGKDSHFQVWLLKKKYGMNPLLVTFNHAYNSLAGLRNLERCYDCLWVGGDLPAAGVGAHDSGIRRGRRSAAVLCDNYRHLSKGTARDGAQHL
jgi:hypothetical protein